MMKTLVPTEKIINEANENIDKVLDALGFDINDAVFYSDDIRSSCPVHNGDNGTAFSYSTKFKKWRCFTHGCHKNNDNIIGLTQKILAVSFTDACTWLTNLLDISNEKVVVVYDDLYKELQKAKKIAYAKRKFETDAQKMDPIPVNSIVPTYHQYFLEIGLTTDTIDFFRLSYCDNVMKPMYQRCFAPVIDDDGKWIIGVTGRSIFNKCEMCLVHHPPNIDCPSNNAFGKYSKWKHYGFKSGQTLYNVCNVKDSVQKTGVAILQEGPKDVWISHQNGLKNCVGIFGKNISDSQISQLVKLGVITVGFCLDNDKAVLADKKEQIALLKRYFNVVDLTQLLPAGKDIADVAFEELKQNYVPKFKGLLNYE